MFTLKFSLRPTTSFLVLAATLTGLSGQASGGAIYFIHTRLMHGLDVFDSGNSAVPVVHDASLASGGATASAHAGSSAAGLSTSAQSTSPIGSYSGGIENQGSQGIARVTADDVFYSGTTSVQVPISLLLAGTISTLGNYVHPDVDVQVILNSTSLTGVYHILPGGPAIRTGFLSSWSPASTGPVSTGLLTLRPGNNTLAIQLRSQVDIDCGGLPCNGSSGTSDFSHTLTLSQTGPVFLNLPTGTTVNSASLNIVNNALVTATPEPGAASLAGIGLLLGGIAAKIRRVRTR